MTQHERVNILLVDDQPAKLLSLEAILADLDENLIKADSADAALKHILTTDVAVLLVDVCMPQMDGFQLAELVREHPRFRRTAIIFISAVHLTDEDRLRGYDLGAVDYIPVPIIPQVLRAKVAVFAELYRKSRELQRVNAELEEHVAQLARSNERLLFADRMATIGTLAAGLGHDLGNLLLPVRLHLDALEASGLSKAGLEDVRAIRTATEYLRRLSGSLRLLSLDQRNFDTQNAATALDPWWQETECMMRNGVPRHVSLLADFAADVPPVRIDKAAMTQIVFNLVQNAGEATRECREGRVRVTARRAPDTSAVYLEVSDNGAGMDETARRRCLEPFFTTKSRGLGTGLGLVLVVGLVQQAKGTIQIESDVGKGTVFRLALPAAPPGQAGITRASGGDAGASGDAPESAPRGQRLTAVVTLADRRLLAHVRSVLESLQYEVRPDQPGDADVWVTDVSESGSIDAAHEFVAERPTSRALVFGASQGGASTERVICFEPDIRPSALHRRIGQALGISTAGDGVPRG